MQIYARVVDSTVAELWPHEPDAPMPNPQPTPIEVFGEEIGSQFVACGPEVQQGWALKGKKFSAPIIVPPTEPVPDRCSKLGLKRALAETGPDAVFPKPEWPAVKEAIASDADLQEDWDLAVSIVRTDPLVQAMVAARKYDDATVDKILVRANALAA
ncbi:hypothetical protein LOK46_10500 [Methylobacterium sp. NMS14P]|uniref:hypothetical protein n=1 Tax=Methylobacterium sp. NMS14P TaxID=2894310 RepID=UPI00235A3609|nr:hypothetical protein [Methylobacterium sp. NMS14P]WCS27219.1 hypothetical protein LOK46_10500 [Methylobacterium sp. NMS14P]